MLITRDLHDVQLRGTCLARPVVPRELEAWQTQEGILLIWLDVGVLALAVLQDEAFDVDKDLITCVRRLLMIGVRLTGVGLWLHLGF